MKYRIKPIKNEKDYKAALEYFETLLNAKEGSPEADERDVLVILLDKYETEQYPIDYPLPIEALKFRIQQLNLKQADLVPYIGSRSKVSEVLSGKRKLTLRMIRALNKHLGIPAEVLLQSPMKKIPEELKGIDFNKFPLSEMEKNHAFIGFDTSNLKDKSEEAIRYLIEKAGGLQALPQALFRKSSRLNAKIDKHALLGWCLHVLAKANEQEISVKYVKENITDKFISGLVSLSIFKEGPSLAKEYLSKYGIILIIVPHMKHTYLDGASFIIKKGTPVIGLTLRYNRIDNYWFVLFHELGHIVKHLKKGKYFADDMSLRGSPTDDKAEKEADQFAEEALLPKEFNPDQIVSKIDILRYAEKYNIHPAIIAGRIQYERKNYRIFSNLIGRGEVHKCFPEIF